MAIELGDDLGGFGEIAVGEGHRVPEWDSNSGRVSNQRKACGLLACVRITGGAAIVSAWAKGVVVFDADVLLFIRGCGRDPTWQNIPISWLHWQGVSMIRARPRRKGLCQ
jgi:hypothetical protein